MAAAEARAQTGDDLSDTSPTGTGRSADPNALLARVRSAVETLVAGAPATDAAGWEHTDRESVITSMDGLIQDLTVYRGKVLLAHRQDGRWGTVRDRDYADWRARTTGAGRGAALGELQVAEGLDAMPEVDAAVAAGDLTLEHAKALARLRAGASEEVKKALGDGMAADLVAKGKKLTAPELTKAAKKAAASIDAQAAQNSFETTWRRRSVTTARTGGARTGTWVLDDVSGTLVETALDAVAGTPAAEDERTREQRLADALVTMASRTLGVGADLNGAQVRPHLAVIVEEGTWAAARRHRETVDAATQAAVDTTHGTGAAFGLDPHGNPRTTDEVDAAAGGNGAGAAGNGAGAGAGCSVTAGARIPALPAVAPAELEDGSIVPLGELLRLMCDCEMTRVVMDADSAVLDVGLTQRTYTKELRRAVTTRDRHCQWPGCRIRAAWSEVHHITFYSHGGATSVENGICLCSYHHHVVHRDHVRIVPLANGFGFYRPDGPLIGTTKRPPRPPRRRNPRAPGDAAPSAGGESRGSRGSPSAAGRPAFDERSPARDPEHDELIAARDQIAAVNGQVSDAARERHGPLLERHRSLLGRRHVSTPAGSGPPTRKEPSHGVTRPPRGDDRSGPPDAGAPPLSLWDATFPEQPAEPPF